MTSRGNSLRRNFSWTIVGNVIYAVCLWGILAVLTKLGNPAVVGRYALASAVVTPVVMFANLQLRSVLAADAQNSHNFGDYFAVRLLMLPAAFLVVLGIGLMNYSGELLVVILLFCVARILEGLSDILFGLAQKNERMDLVSRSLMIKGLFGLILVGSVFAATRSLIWAMVAFVTAWAVPLLTFDLPQARAQLLATGQELRPRWSRPVFGQIVWLTLPLGLVMMLAQLRHTIPRTYLVEYWSEDEVGVIAALTYMIVAGSTVVMALGQSSLAPLAKIYSAGRLADFRRLVLKLVLLGSAVGVLGILVAVFAGRELLTLIYTAEYGAYEREFVVVMIAGAFYFVGGLLGPAATSMKAFRGQLLIQVVNVGLMLVLAWLLIPTRGIMGAVLTMLGGAAWIVVGMSGLIIWKLRGSGKNQ
ncbi:MAG: O-antigen/teichoic acid export membrane protein [Candidatus Krumholzibacteriia bacterium]|jgi:O-antigen/teichoic acid export membrane protein